jgi:hypothetical protein
MSFSERVFFKAARRTVLSFMECRVAAYLNKALFGDAVKRVRERSLGREKDNIDCCN